jgi:hypothetical protein
VWLAIQLTNVSVIVYFVWAAVYFRGVAVVARVAVALFCAAVLYVLTQTVFRVSIEASEADAYRRVAKGLRNPRRLRDAPLRISFLTLSVMLFYVLLFVYTNFRVPLALLSYPLVVLTTVLLYVLACDPLPPCAGKLKVWVRGLVPSRAPAPESLIRRGTVSTLCRSTGGRRASPPSSSASASDHSIGWRSPSPRSRECQWAGYSGTR